MNTSKVAREVRMNKWAEIIGEQKASGQNITAWCASNGVDKQRYHYWKRKLRERACESLISYQEKIVAPPVSFTEISLPTGAPCAGVITVRMGETIVEISGDALPEAIEAVMRGLNCR